MDIEQIKPKVNKSKLKKPSKHSTESLYRDYPHSTVNGEGVVARIKKKRK